MRDPRAKLRIDRYSNYERATALERAPSRKLLKEASSASANLTISSYQLEGKDESVKFSFDSVLLGSKVYRRTCGPSLIREVSSQIKNEGGANLGGPISTRSVSSISAIASEGDRASSSGTLDVAHERHGEARLDSAPWPIHDGEHEERHILKVPDAGPAELRSSSIDPTAPEIRGSARAYGGPKPGHHSTGHRMPLNLEIWSLGCIMLAFACWLASGGSQEPKVWRLPRYATIPHPPPPPLKSLAGGPGKPSPTSHRYIQTRHGTFFDVVDGEVARRLPSTAQFKDMCRSMAVLDATVREACLSLGLLESYFESVMKKIPPAATMGQQDASNTCNPFPSGCSHQAVSN